MNKTEHTNMGGCTGSPQGGAGDKKGGGGKFVTRMGVVAVTVGSAVGLGNIWRFPFEAGAGGGGAFLLLNILMVLAIGVPVVCAEFVIGRHTGSAATAAFRQLVGERRGRWWGIVGVSGLVASVLILGFYSVVAGWTLEYSVMAAMEGFHGNSAADLHDRFGEMSANPWRAVGWTLIFLAINYFVLRRGVEKGIERVANVLMPLLFVILAAFCINSMLMPGAADGLSFLFKPDFSKVTPQVVLSAMGQAFFSLSLGLGCLITYSSYFPKSVPLVRTASMTAGLDLLVAVMAGMVIFPAMFTFGQESVGGPRLVFEVLPSIFGSMPGGRIWGVLFFILLAMASLTSTVSMSEISIAWLTREKGMSRKAAVNLNMVVAVVLGVLCSLSFGVLSGAKLFGMTIFELFDFVASNVLLPLGGMLISVFVGWLLKRSLVRRELLQGVKHPGKAMNLTVNVIIFLLRWVAPVCIAMVFVAGIV